jgi:Sec-independent protein secretion pathway component TatC
MFDAIGTVLGTVTLIAAMVVGFGLLFSLPVWLLWNYCLVGAVAGVSQITWLQAWGILILCGFLFKSTATK